MDNIEVRLSALEFLMRGLLAKILMLLPKSQADNFATSLSEGARRVQRFEGAPLRDVEEIEAEAAAIWAAAILQIEGARAIEKAFRESQSKGTTSS